MTMHFKASLRVNPAHSSGLPAAPSPRHRLYRTLGKRLFDLIIVAATAPMALVLIAIAAALTARDGHNPFFVQNRLGRNGRVFRLVKLRTMVPDAEARLDSYLAANPKARAEWDHKQKLDNDPRITPLGQFLRKSSLDELPQLWNVFTGAMSIVGPRPMMECQRDLYPGRAYFTLRPGVTGNWQVSDRNETGFAERAVYDDAYAAKVSLGNDIDILVRTAGVVLRCTGR